VGSGVFSYFLVVHASVSLAELLLKHFLQAPSGMSLITMTFVAQWPGYFQYSYYSWAFNSHEKAHHRR
jgi:hypothetical protein